MPGLTSQVVIMQHNSASDFLSFASPTLRRNEASSNIVFAHALKGVSSDVAMGGFQFTCDSDVMKRLDNTPASSFPANRNNDCFWLTVWTRTQSSIPSLDLVLSCVKWKLGNYPIFLWTSNLPFSHDSQWLLPRISKLAEHLRKCVPIERVFSVFGMTILVKTFSTLWSSITGLEVEPSPFYAAFFSYCDSDTFRSSNAVLPQGHCLRRAELADLEQVTQLCKEFADDSVRLPEFLFQNHSLISGDLHYSMLGLLSAFSRKSERRSPGIDTQASNLGL